MNGEGDATRYNNSIQLCLKYTIIEKSDVDLVVDDIIIMKRDW